MDLLIDIINDSLVVQVRCRKEEEEIRRAPMDLKWNRSLMCAGYPGGFFKVYWWEGGKRKKSSLARSRSETPDER